MSNEQEMRVPLSERLRPDVECAPWVIEEVRKLEAATLAAEARIRDLEADANLWRFVYYSEDYAVCSYEDGRGSSQGRSDYEPVLLEQIAAALTEHKENQV